MAIDQDQVGAHPFVMWSRHDEESGLLADGETCCNQLIGDPRRSSDLLIQCSGRVQSSIRAVNRVSSRRW
jgi:hypothetical protein